MELTSEVIETIAQRVKELLSNEQAALSSEQLAGMIDHTCLKPDAASSDIKKLCEEAIEHGFCSVCVNSSFAPYANRLVSGSAVKLCCVVGFPLGAQPSKIKALEAREAIRSGANEIDMVINIGALKDKNYGLVERDIRAVVSICKKYNALSKVILETCLLTDEEKVIVCELCVKAGADFVKTSTGFSKSGATAEDIALMSRTVKAHGLGVKASGGVRTHDDAMTMIKAGATRIGASSSINIVQQS